MFECTEKEVNEQASRTKDNMNQVLEDMKTLRQEVNQKLGAGLHDLSTATQCISAGILTELEAFHAQVKSPSSNACRLILTQ